MQRYLKSIEMKSKDGATIHPPLCCLICNKGRCPLSCGDYENEMQNTKCVHVVMEFGLVDTLGDVIRKCIEKAILLIIIACIPIALFFIATNLRQSYEISVDRYTLGSAQGTGATVSCLGKGMNASCVMPVLNKLTAEMSEEKGQ